MLFANVFSPYLLYCALLQKSNITKKNTVDSTQEGVQKHRKCFVLFYCKACIPTKQTQKVNLEFNLCKINQSYLVAYSQYGDDATYTFHHTALQIYIFCFALKAICYNKGTTYCQRICLKSY